MTEDIFITELNRMEQNKLIFVGSKKEIGDWIRRNAARLALPGRDVREILRGAVGRANAGGRCLTLNHIIDAYSAKTGRPNEWDFVTDTSLYRDDDSAAITVPSKITDSLLYYIGPASCLPDDGRLPLTFSRSFFTSMPHDQAEEIIESVTKSTEKLQQEGNLTVVDWGWPRGLWSPTMGCVYVLPVVPCGYGARTRYSRYDPTLAIPEQRSKPAPQQQWKDKGFTCGLRHILNSDQSDEHRAASCGKPWRRLV
jgi:hypothetical protein